MEAVWQWGIDLIHSIQMVQGPALTGFFTAITFTGDEEFFLLLIPLIFWCVDYTVGVRLSFAFIFSVFINSGLKDIIGHPRPFELDPTVKLREASGYGLPSGHSQSSVVVWGTIAYQFRERWMWIGAVVMAVLVGFSRIYLGVHFPTDVFAGWTVGILFLAAYVALGPRVEAWIQGNSMAVQLALAVAVPLVLLLIYPFDIDSVDTALSALLGMGVGIVLFKRMATFDAGGPLWQRIVRFLVGAVGIAILYVGLKVVFPDEGEPLYVFLRIVRYALVGAWISLGGPWLFIRLKLSPQHAVEQ